MARRVAIVLLTPVRWAPPGVDAGRWRRALAEDMVDLLATMSEVEPAIAAVEPERSLAAAVVWPGMPVYLLPRATTGPALEAAAAAGFTEAAVLPADAPDLPALHVGKLLRPLTTRSVSAAPASGGRGLVGLAARLPGPGWLPDVDLDSGSLAALRALAPAPGEVASAPGWRRLRAPGDLATLDPALDGWEATRALLGRSAPRS